MGHTWQKRCKCSRSSGPGIVLKTLCNSTYNHPLSLNRYCCGWQAYLFSDPLNGRVLQNVAKYEKLLVSSQPKSLSSNGPTRPNSNYLRTRDTYERLCQTQGSQVLRHHSECTSCVGKIPRGDLGWVNTATRGFLMAKHSWIIVHLFQLLYYLLPLGLHLNLFFQIPINWCWQSALVL